MLVPPAPFWQCDPALMTGMFLFRAGLGWVNSLGLVQAHVSRFARFQLAGSSFPTPSTGVRPSKQGKVTEDLTPGDVLVGSGGALHEYFKRFLSAVNKLLSEFKNSLFLTASEWTRWLKAIPIECFKFPLDGVRKQ